MNNNTIIEDYFSLNKRMICVEDKIMEFEKRIRELEKRITQSTSNKAFTIFTYYNRIKIIFYAIFFVFGNKILTDPLFYKIILKVFVK